jgi:TonB family protein
MASASSVAPPLDTDRRISARRRLEGLAYVDLGPDNGAILIDLGEGGLGFQSVAPVSLDQAVLLKLKVPGRSEYIETFAEVIWLNESGKGGGLRFSELPAQARDQIRDWMGVSSTLETVAAAQVSAVPAQSTSIASDGNSAQSWSIPATERAVTEVPAAEAVASIPAEEVPERIAERADGVTGIAEINEPVEPEEAESAEAADPQHQPAAAIVADVSSPAAAIAEEAASQQIERAGAPAPVRAKAEIPTPQTAPAASAVPAAPKTAPPKARPNARVVSESIPNRVHSGILAAAAAESGAGDAPDASAPEPPATSAPAKRAPVFNAAPVHAPKSHPEIEKQPQSAPARSAVFNDPRGNAPVSATPQQTFETAPWEIATAGDESAPTKEVLSSQLLKIGIAAIAGATVVLAIVALVPTLRTRVQATSAKSNAPGLSTAAPEFQIEVADLNNRRWTLKSGGEAGSPFSDPPSRRASTASARDAADKSSRSSDDGGSADTNDTPSPSRRTAQRGTLGLTRPLAGRPAAPQMQAMAPSIFDGITPPVGSLSDTLPVSGPAMPGPVTSQQQGPQPASLEAAVLVHRVPPLYPAEARESHVAGEVRVSATIDKNGVPTNLKAVSGDPQLAGAALMAIRQWRYRPATLDGKPIETTTTISVSFELQ